MQEIIPKPLLDEQPINGQASADKGELFRFALIIILVVLPIRIFIAQPFVVNGASMSPTFESGDYLIVDELTYRLRAPKRGEVLIFRYPKDPSKFFIKRIIGLPGETLNIEGNSFTVTAGGESHNISGTFVRPETIGGLRTTLAQDEYYVLGDNREASSDSRIWGPVNKSQLIGRPIVRLLPIKELDLIPGDYSSNSVTTK